MSPSLDVRRVLAESLPIAGIVLFWVAASWLALGGIVADGVRLAGLVVGLGYAVVRGLDLADGTEPGFAAGDVEGLLRANLAILLPAAAWFLAGRLVVAVALFWRRFVRVGAFRNPGETLAFAFTATGVLTVVVGVVAICVASARGGRRSTPTDAPGTAPADD